MKEALSFHWFENYALGFRLIILVEFSVMVTIVRTIFFVVGFDIKDAFFVLLCMGLQMMDQDLFEKGVEEKNHFGLCLMCQAPFSFHLS